MRSSSTSTMKTLLCFLFVAFIFSTCVHCQTDYCQICANHTLCIYPDSPSPRCNVHIFSGVTAADITTIVDTHNLYRTRVASGNETRGNPGPQPAASNMRALIWDPELANICLVWTKQCIVSTDMCRNVPRFRVGQNIYWTACRGGSSCNTTPDWRGALDSWYGTVRNFSNRNIDPFMYTDNTGTYTQMVWATTRYIGCSCIVYRSFDGWINKLYGCNYGGAGNIVGSMVYKKGTPCTSCTNTTCSANRVLCD